MDVSEEERNMMTFDLLFELDFILRFIKPIQPNLETNCRKYSKKSLMGQQLSSQASKFNKRKNQAEKIYSVENLQF